MISAPNVVQVSNVCSDLYDRTYTICTWVQSYKANSRVGYIRIDVFVSLRPARIHLSILDTNAFHLIALLVPKFVKQIFACAK